MGVVFTNASYNPLPEGKKIVLALLSWNTRQASLDSLNAYLREAQMLQRLGHIPLICVCDNGSLDGTVEAFKKLESQIDFPHKFIFNSSNVGSSIARNQIIDCVLECDADYVMFLDGDIEIVPFSVFAMLRYMEANGHRLGCIGANSMGQTSQRAKASTVIYSLSDFRIATTNVVAWTQYGLFRRAIFDAGVRFDESSPFNQPGWGFEDNDLAYQMETKGFVNQFFSGMTYLHRNARSSVRLLRQERVDVD
jgi:glycosyltransferase involved in cell wall biosynthesis